MRRIGSILLKGVGLVAFTFACGVVALQVLDYLDSSASRDVELPPPNSIHIIEASYGLNCQPSPGWPVTPKAGNATKVLVAFCEDALEDCSFVGNVTEFGGDPAPGCAKDLLVDFRCSRDPEEHKLHVPGEAHGKGITLRCATPN